MAVSVVAFALSSMIDAALMGQAAQQQAVQLRSYPDMAGLWELDVPATQALMAASEAAAQKAASEQADQADIAPTVLSTTTLSSITPTATPVEQVTGGVVLDTLPAAGCRERYNFGQDGQLVTVSGAEWTRGEYAIIEPDADELPSIVIRTMHDNNQPDCAGNQNDQTGEEIAAFMKYDASKNIMQWCADGAGVECYMQFRRLTP